MNGRLRAVLAMAACAGCVFTSRPMIPDNVGTDAEDAGGRNALGDAAVARDAGSDANVAPTTDRGPLVGDLPPSFEDVGATTPGTDAGAAADVSGGGGGDSATGMLSDAGLADEGDATSCGDAADATDAACPSDAPGDVAGPDVRTAD